MSNELFQGGTRLYTRDQAELQNMAAQTALTQQRTKNEAADLELNPLRAELLKAQTGHQVGSTEHQQTLADLNRAQASTILRKANQEDRVAAVIAAALGKKKASPSPQFDDEGNPMPQAEEEQTGIADLADIGNRVVAAGDVDRGGKYLKLAADLTKEQATTRASLAAEKVRLANTELKKIEFMQQVLSGVKDPASHARAVLILKGNQLTADEDMKKSGLDTYNQPLIDQLLAGSKVQLAKKRVEISGFAAASADQARKAAQETRDILAGYAEQRTKAYVERAGALAKTGDEKSVPAPNGAEIKLMRQELAEAGEDFDPEEDPAAVAELAEQAKILYTRNPSVTRKEAMTTVIKGAKERGDLVSGEKRRYAPNKKAKYNQSEGTVAMPLPVPTDPAGLVEGNYYRSSKGVVKQYKGGEFVDVSKRVPKGK